MVLQYYWIVDENQETTHLGESQNARVPMTPRGRWQAMSDKAYRTKKWKKFREEALRLAGYRCENCERSQSEGAILQVHHKDYLPGFAAWDYDYSLCDVLCKACHARRHGRIMPSEGWVCDGDNDLGDLVGECDRCGTQLRYQFFITHPMWHDMIVGTNCCDELTGTKQASDKRRLIERRKAFCDLSYWLPKSGQSHRKFKNVEIDIVEQEGSFFIIADGRTGRQIFGDQLSAKLHVHDLFESGKLKEYLKRQRKKALEKK